jgi:hypothetical protein
MLWKTRLRDVTLPHTRVRPPRNIPGPLCTPSPPVPVQKIERLTKLKLYKHVK